MQWHNQPELVAAELVSGNYFDVLGVQPALGRVLVASDDVVPDANPVVVLSFSYWQRRFGADPTVVNQSLLVNGRPFTILGVAPPGFHSVVMGDTPDLFAAHDDEGRDQARESRIFKTARPDGSTSSENSSPDSPASRPKPASILSGIPFAPTN